MPGVLNQSREIARHRCDEAKQVAERLLGAPRCLHRLIALSHGAVDEWLDALDQTELRVVLVPEPLEGDERLEQEREVARQNDGVLAEDLRYSVEKHPDFQILQLHVGIVER